MYIIRPLTFHDIPRLAEIRPGFTAPTVIKVELTGTPPFQGWVLREEPLKVPFNKGHLYDFDANEQANIRERLTQPDNLLEVVEQDHKMVGILDIERETWRNTGWIWNIMLDESARGQGLGRQLIERSIEWGKAKKLRAIMLETQTNNTPACHFYARMGFQLVGVNTLFYTNHDLEDQEVALFWAYPLR